MEERFQWKPFIKSIIAIGVPIALTNLLTTTASMVDTIMIGMLGENSVAAVGLCAQFSSLMFSCYWGFVGGGLLFYGQYWGSKNEKGIARSFGMTNTAMMTVSVIFSLLATCFPSIVMSIYTDKSSLISIGTDYLKIVGLSYPINVFSVCVVTLLRATERVKIPLVSSISAVATNIFLNWVFIFGHLGSPALGVKGAAIATLIAQCVNLTLLLILSKKKKVDVIFKIKDHFLWSKDFFKMYFKKCSPIVLNEIMMGIANMLISIVLGHQKESIVASVAVFRTLEGLIIAFFQGFSSSSSVLVGTAVGSGDSEIALKRANRIVYLCQGFIFILVFSLVLCHGPILRLMSLKGDSFNTATMMLFVYAFFSVFRMGNWTQNDTFRAGGDSFFGTFFEILFMYVLVLPALFLSNYYFKAPFFVVFISCYIDEPIRYIIMQVHMHSGKWMKPVTPEGIEGLKKFKEKVRLSKNQEKKIGHEQ